MKKNKMMRIASVLLIAVLLSTSVISGTFAKYVTSDSVADSARVAKFGVVVTAGGHLFAENYYNVDAGDAHNHNYAEGVNQDAGNIASLTVETSNGDKLVAPGTGSDTDDNGTLTFDISGTPEVDVLVTIDIDDVKDVVLKASGEDEYPDVTTGKSDFFTNEEDYYPVVYTLKVEPASNVGGANYWAITGKGATVNMQEGTVTGNLQQIVDALDIIFKTDENGVYVDANTDLSTVIGKITLSWAWDFDDNGKGTYDKQDTLLGDIAAADKNDIGTSNGLRTGCSIEGVRFNAGDDYCLDTSIAIAISVTQVD